MNSLQARMDQMERMLANLQTEQAEQADETQARQVTSRESFLEPGSLTSLSGYVMMCVQGSLLLKLSKSSKQDVCWTWPDLR